MKEREINLTDLVFEILLKWRMILIFMLIGGILLAGYTYWQSVETIKVQQSELQNQEKDFTAEILQLEGRLTDVQKNNVRSALNYENYNEKYNEYYNSSILMQIDANNIPTMELIFNVEVQNEKDKIILCSVYSKIIEKGILQWLTENGINEIEASKVAELITVKAEVGSQEDILLSGNKGIIQVVIVQPNKEQCMALAESIKEFVFAKEEEVEAVYGEVEIALVNESYSAEMDLDVLTKQRSVLINMISGNTASDNIKKAFSADETQYYEMLKESMSNDAAEETILENKGGLESVVTPSPSINVKLVIVGMFAIAFLCVFGIFLMYMFNNKLRATDSMAELYDIVQLGVVSTVGGKKKFLGFVDNLIIKLRDRNKRQFTKEESEEIVAVAIKMAVKKLGDKEVSFVGCDIKKYTEEISNEIKVLLEKEGIAVSVVDNILYNAENLEKLENIKNVVLLEKVGFTMYDEVEQELEVMKRYNINVVGAVLVD